MRFIRFFIVIGLMIVQPVNQVAALTAQLLIEGADFVVQLSDGRSLRGEDLIGLKIKLRHEGQDVEVRIDQVEKDEEAIGGPVTLYRMSVLDPSDGASRDLCQPDALGRRAGFPLSPGDGFGFTCTSGAEGKCVLMGYRPWEAPQNGVSPAELHRACVHVMRADYGGDNRPSTRDGTLVDVYDRFGIRTPAENSGMEFEAAWGPEGAICVAHPRIPENISLDQLAEHYPRLKDRLGPQACTEAAMRSEPQALLFNKSLVTPRSTP